MLDGSTLSQAVLAFIRDYGLFALFIYLVLETSLVLHFVPSEVVVPVAASQLVRGPTSFVAFVVVATAGTTCGSLFPYTLFGRYGRDLADRYGRYVRLSSTDIDRGERWFRRWGQTSVFWGRVIPFVRTLISVPAGLTELPLYRFLIYTAAGTAIYNTTLTYLVYSGGKSRSPLATIVTGFFSAVTLYARYTLTHPQVVAGLVTVVVAVAGYVWLRREWIRANPAAAKRQTVSTIRTVGVCGGALFVFAGLVDPDNAFALLMWIWDDPTTLVGLGLSKTLALTAVGVVFALGAFALAVLVAHTPFGRLAGAVRQRFRTDASVTDGSGASSGPQSGTGSSATRPRRP